jgi:two-component system sensor histidine kinase KdpD
VLAAIVGMLCLNFFFLPPVGTFTITDPENWVALAAFLIVAITAGQLSGRARRRAEIAEERRREIDRIGYIKRSETHLIAQVMRKLFGRPIF